MQYLQVLNREKYSTVPASQIDENDIKSNHSMIVGFLVNSIENPRSIIKSCLAMSTYESEAPGIAGMTTPSQALAGAERRLRK